MRLARLAGLASLCLLAACPARPPDELRVVYSAGLRIGCEAHEWSTSEKTTKVEGDERLEELIPLLEGIRRPEREDTFSDVTTWVDAVEDGRPVAGRRRFDELRRNKRELFDTQEEGELLGRTVVLTSGAPGGGVVTRLAEGDRGPDVDEIYLADHGLVLGIEHYLPGRAVEVGDTWQLELPASDDHPIYFASEATADDELEPWLRELARRGDFEASGSVEYERREKLRGVECAVLVLSYRRQALASEVDVPGQDILTPTKLWTWKEVEERLWFALEAGRPLRSEGTWKTETKGCSGIPGANGEVTQIELTQTRHGGFERSWRYREPR